MTVKELIEKLNNIEDKDKVTVIFDGYGWANVEKIEETNTTIRIIEEINPLFSD